MKINFSQHFQQLVDKYGDNEALVNVERNRRYSYKELHCLTNKIANVISQTLGLDAGDKFLNILDNDNMSLLHVMTIFKGRATGVFTNFRDGLSEHRWQVEFAKPKVVFIENSLLDSHYAMLEEQGVTVVCMDEPSEKWKQKLNDGLFYFWDLVDAASDESPNIELDDREHLVVIRFTGGTTGKGKPATYTLDNWLAIRESFYSMPDHAWDSQSRMLHLAPVSHASGLLVLPPFYKGACSVTLNEPDLVRYCQTIEKEKVTHSMLVPTILYRLLELIDTGRYDLSSLKTMFYGAAPMTAEKLKLLQEKIGNIFIQMYASTEHPAIAISLSKKDHQINNADDEKRLASIGQVLPGTEVMLMDEQGKPVVDGEIGELWLRSLATIQGYYLNPEKTADEFIDGFWKSGDMARKDERGFYYVVDRKKDMIISGGFNIYSNEVEASINSHESVLMSAVVGVPHAEWGEAVHAEVILREGKSLSDKELIDHVKEHLSRLKAPKTLKFVDQLPLSSVGKILRRKVREKYWVENDKNIG